MYVLSCCNARNDHMDVLCDKARNHVICNQSECDNFLTFEISIICK